MKRRLVTIIMAIVMFICLTPTRVHAENTPIDSIDFSNFFTIPSDDELASLDGKSVDDLSLGYIFDYYDLSYAENVYMDISKYEKNNFNNRIGSVFDDGEIFDDNYSYQLNVFLHANYGYGFICSDSDDSNARYFNKNNIKPHNSKTTARLYSSFSYNSMVDDFPIVSQDGEEGYEDTYIWISYPLIPNITRCTTWESLRENIDSLYVPSSTTLTSATIILDQDITATDTDATLYIYDGMDVTIDLNGHVLNRNLINADGTTKDRPQFEEGHFVEDFYDPNYSGSVIEVWGGKLTIKDSSPNTQHAGFVDNNNLWHLGTGTGKAKTIKGGIITGGIGMIYTPGANAGGYFEEYFRDQVMGGGILIANSSNAVVTLEGGNICGNLADDYGGGVAIVTSDNMTSLDYPYNIIREDKPKFIMNGGSICNNYVSYENDEEYPYISGTSSYLDERRGGGGIYAFQGDVEINDGHVDENLSKHFAGGILGYLNANITIKGGTINNNVGRIAGAIWNFIGKNDRVSGMSVYEQDEYDGEYHGIPEHLLLTADEGKEIVITGNKSQERGNVYSNHLYLSGKVIIKNNTCDNYVVVLKEGKPDEFIFPGLTSNARFDETGKLIVEDEQGYSVTKAYGNDIMYVVTDYTYDPNYYYTMTTTGDPLSTFKIVGDLTGSDINVSFIGCDFAPVDYRDPSKGVLPIDITSDFVTYNPDAKATDYFHNNGLNVFYLTIDNDYNENEIVVKLSKQTKEVESEEDFENILEDAAAQIEENPDITYSVELSGDIGSEQPLEELAVPPNVELELNGNDVYIDGPVSIFGELVDSGGEDESGNPVKGKIFMNNPEDIIYNSLVETDEDDGSRQELVWTEATDNMNGYYCMYKVGANTKWDEVEEGSGVWTKGQDKAKFKIQPTAYEELANGLTQVYGADTIVKVGIRVTLIKNNPNNPTHFDFPFKEGVLSEWVEKNDPELNNKCISAYMSGLKSYSNVGAQAAIYSKIKPTNIFEDANSPFISKLRLADDSEE